MERWQGILSIGRVLLVSLRLMLRLAVQMVLLSRARRAAVKGFKQGLKETGVPPGVVAVLSKSYPRINFRGIGQEHVDRKQAPTSDTSGTSR